MKWHLFFIAALRELFKAKGGKCWSGNMTRILSFPRTVQTEINVDVNAKMNLEDDEAERSVPSSSNLKGLNDTVDEFFDVPEPLDDDFSEDGWLNTSPEINSVVCSLYLISFDLHYVNSFDSTGS